LDKLPQPSSIGLAFPHLLINEWSCKQRSFATMQILFNKTIEQCRQLGARGGRACGRNLRLRQSQAPLPSVAHLPAPPSETARQASLRLDAQFPWLAGAFARRPPRNLRPGVASGGLLDLLPWRDGPCKKLSARTSSSRAVLHHEELQAVEADGRTKQKPMKHFTIDNENYINLYASRNAARETGASVFSTEEQFADLSSVANITIRASGDSVTRNSRKEGKCYV
jgi:hypothetical protein